MKRKFLVTVSQKLAIVFEMSFRCTPLVFRARLQITSSETAFRQKHVLPAIVIVRGLVAWSDESRRKILQMAAPCLPCMVCTSRAIP